MEPEPRQNSPQEPRFAVWTMLVAIVILISLIGMATAILFGVNAAVEHYVAPFGAGSTTGP